MTTFRSFLVGLLLAATAFPSHAQWSSDHGRVRMDSIEALTFHQGRQTNARRVGAVQELNCIGGDARYEAQRSVHAIQCRKVGMGGTSSNDVQWKCEADLPVEYKLGETTVSCEGYDHPNDPYVLQGSCGLEYTLHRTGASPSDHSHRYSNSNSHQHSSSNGDWLFGVLFILFIVGSICSPSSSHNGNNGYHHHGYNHGCSGGSSFLSGAATGAAAASLFSSRRPTASSSRWGGGGSQSRVSTGFGGTRNR